MTLRMLAVSCTAQPRGLCSNASLVLVQFYILRKLIEHELGEQEVGEDDCYICSLSSRILVYKGQLTPGQVLVCD